MQPSRVARALEKAGVTGAQLTKTLHTLAMMSIPDDVQAIDLDDRGRVGGYLCVFSNRAAVDLHMTYFDRKRTNFFEHAYKGGIPIYFDHGITDNTVIGHIYGMTRTPKGLQPTEARLNLKLPLAAKLWADVQAGKVYWSSGSNERAIRIKKDGCITDYPIIEASLTYAPAGRKSGDELMTYQGRRHRRNAHYLAGVVRVLERYGIKAADAVVISTMLPKPF